MQSKRRHLYSNSMRALVFISTLIFGFAFSSAAEKQESVPQNTLEREFRKHLIQGTGHSRANQHILALEEFKLALLIRPNDAEMYASLGTSYFRLGMNDKAWACYALSLKLNKNQPEMLAWLKSQKGLRNPPPAGTGQAVLKWPAAPGAEGYLVYQKRGRNLPDLKVTTRPIPKPRLLVASLVPADPYRFSITKLVRKNGILKEEPLGDLLTFAVWARLFRQEKKK